MIEGWELRGNDRGIIIRRGEYEVKFNICILSTTTGCVWVGYFRRTQVTQSELAAVSLEQKVSIQYAHDLLGHSNEEATRVPAKHLKWNLTRGVLKNCKACAKGKGKQKNIAKESKHVKADVPRKQMFLDIKSMMEPKKTRRLLRTLPSLT